MRFKSCSFFARLYMKTVPSAELNDRRLLDIPVTGCVTRNSRVHLLRPAFSYNKSVMRQVALVPCPMPA